MTEKQKTGMERAVDAAGSQVKLAEALGVKQQAISIWLLRGYAPMDRAKEIEMAFGIPRIELLSPKVRSMVESGEVL
jgi:hypothetical protein